MSRKIIGVTVGTNLDPQKVAEQIKTPNAIHNSASGETVVTTDSANATPSITLFGKSEQATYQGNQLFDVNNVVATTKSGITVEKDGDYITINGTGTDSYIIFGDWACDIPSGTTVWFYVVEGDASDLGFYLRDANKGLVHDFTYVKSVTLDKDAKYFRITCKEKTYNTKLKIMLTDKENAEWEPFVGGEASPSLSYKQDVVPHGASGSIEQRFYGKNIIRHRGSIKPINTTINGVTFTVHDDWSVTANGTATASVQYSLGYAYLYKGQTYKVVGCAKGGSDTSYRIAVGYLNQDYGEGSKAKRSPDDYDSYCCILIGEGTTLSNLTFKPMVYLSEVFDETYEPPNQQLLVHQTPNGLGGIPLGQTIPDVIKNSPIHMSGVYHDGKQYWIADTVESGQRVQRTLRMKSKKILAFNDDVGNGRYGLWLPSFFDTPSDVKYLYIGGALPAYCNIAEWSQWANGKDKTFCLTGDGLWYKESTKTREEVNSMFAEVGTDIEIVGIMRDPIITDLTDEEKAQYNAIHMNYPNTTIVNSDSAYTEVEYVADTKCYIDNKFKEMKADMTSAIAQLL